MPLPVWLVYAQVVKFVKEHANDNPIRYQYYVDLLGADTIIDAPERYYDIATAIELGVPLSDWDNPEKFTLRDKAEIRAQSYLKNMVDVVERHYKMQDDQEKKRGGGNFSSLQNPE